MSKKKHKKPPKPEMHLALEGNLTRKAKPKLTPDQRRIKSDAWRVLDYNRPRLEEL